MTKNNKTNEYYTSAGNFVTAIQGGVDPRTGLYNVTLPLVNIRANHLTGPEFSLTLSYSPLSSQNIGFGTGFKLNLSEYDTKNGQLLLSTGEHYCVDNDGHVKQKKLNNFIFKKLDSRRFKIIHKSGLIEHLDMHSGEIYVTSKISSPEGRSLTLKWNSRFIPARLSEIVDDNNHTICSISYPDNLVATTRFTIYPNDPDSMRGMTFKFRNEKLVSLISRITNGIFKWYFDYSDIGPNGRYNAIIGLTSPTGLVEKVKYYNVDGMQFPSIANLPSLPCVYEHLIIPGMGQPQMKTKWTYTRKNYLGKDAGLNQWQPDTDQMLNILLGNYLYGSNEQHLDENDNILCTVKRLYNSYHLLMSEETIRDGKIHAKTSEYYAIPGRAFTDQPVQYMLPKTQTEAWSIIGETSRRTCTTRFEFDSNGNAIRQEAPDGTVIEFTYYDVLGEGDDCPADQYGFVRYLKAMTTTPYKVNGNEVISTETHTWKKLDALIDNEFCVIKNTTNHTTGNRSKMTHYTYFEDRSNRLLYGRIKTRNISVVPNINDSQKFTNIEQFTYQFDSNRMTEITNFTGFDGIQITSNTTKHIFNGKKVSEVSSLGIERRYIFDAFDRMIKEISCPESEYEQVKTWEYGVGATGNYIIESDPSEIKKKNSFDCVGRKIREQSFDNDRSIWLETSSYSYNALGEKVTRIEKDWLMDSNVNKCVSLQFDISYNGWGDREKIVSSNGLTKFELFDHINLQRITYTQNDVWQMVSGKTITSFDSRSLCPISKELRTSAGQRYSIVHYKWDGSGRLIEETDENGEITKFSYDECGRLLTSMLPDGTVVHRTYAPHLDGKKINTVSVSSTPLDDGDLRIWFLGRQTFDSLERVTERTSGGRRTIYSYQNASAEPSTIILPSGKMIQYSYIPSLDNAVSNVNADGITQTFDYNFKTGDLLSAKESDFEIKNIWGEAGALKEEVFMDKEKSYRTYHSSTLHGAPISYTDVTSKKIQNELDQHGRIAKVIDENLTIDLTYDGLGRLSTQQVHDTKSNVSLTTTFAYDSFDMEIKRTITDDNGMTLVLEQEWQNNGLLSKRITKQNRTIIREEQFLYDNRKRLIEFDVIGSGLPFEAYGHQMSRQTYVFDAMSNLMIVQTKLSDDTTDTATYIYENKNDPCQLTLVKHTHNDLPNAVNLHYDAEGRMTLEEAGRTLTYDVMGRLIGIGDNENGNAASYKYDAFNRLRSQDTINSDISHLFYRGNELANEMCSSQKYNRLIKMGHNCVGVESNDDLTLNINNENGTPIWSVNTMNRKKEFHSWSPYGSGTSIAHNRLGFNGERIDPISHVYHLGNGYRAYSTTLMRFTCPDSLSPFGEGGINAYAYCDGDPINNVDPSGHISWQGWLGIAIGVVGIVATVATAGMAIAAVGGIAAAWSAASTTALVTGGLGLVSEAAAITGGILEDSHPEVSNVLGYVSLATGLPGFVKGAVQIAKSVTKLPQISKKITNVVKNIARSKSIRQSPTLKPYFAVRKATQPAMNFGQRSIPRAMKMGTKAVARKLRSLTDSKLLYWKDASVKGGLPKFMDEICTIITYPAVGMTSFDMLQKTRLI